MGIDRAQNLALLHHNNFTSECAYDGAFRSETHAAEIERRHCRRNYKLPIQCRRCELNVPRVDATLAVASDEFFCPSCHTSDLMRRRYLCLKVDGRICYFEIRNGSIFRADVKPAIFFTGTGGSDR